MKVPRYLIEGNQGAVLHTGDIRCEPSFIEALKKHPLLLPYIRPRDDKGKGKGKGKEGDSPNKQLEAIYLDTACMLFRPELPSKVGIFVWSDCQCVDHVCRNRPWMGLSI